ncbi:hypothetical protein [Clostridium sp. KNHs214]|uniref:hypothetical protein n=1 Tax=Clostridium sp. KNHs214 TaxID=1540257 RepID=UPI00054F1A05|nr:hypothetical protein [Clostridium sp. KNHs214]
MIFRKKKDEFLQSVIDNYKSHFNRSSEKFNIVYKEIEDIYKGIISKDKNFNISMEKNRLENIKYSIESNTNAYLITILCLIITIVLDNFSKYIGNKLFSTIFFSYLLIIAFLYFMLGKYAEKSLIYDIAIKVLVEQIEKEKLQVEESNKAIKETATTLENNINNVQMIQSDMKEIKQFLGIK